MTNDQAIAHLKWVSQYSPEQALITAKRFDASQSRNWHGLESAVRAHLSELLKERQKTGG